MEKKTKALIILSAFVLIFTIIGGTLAYFQWISSNEQKTNVTFTVAQGFSCSADGGGSLTSNDVQLAPAACTNATNAIKRTITVHPTITQTNKTIYLDMWLKVNSISSNLSASQNFKYALTTSASNCTTDVVTQGDFNGATTNTQKTLLHEKEYSVTTAETYYLWIWLDNAETNSNTMNQSFNIELGGNCTDEAPATFSGTIYVYPGTSAQIGRRLATYSKQAWCANYYGNSNSCTSGLFFETESECQEAISDPRMTNSTCNQGTVQPISYETDPANLWEENYLHNLKLVLVDDVVTESYVEFVVKPWVAWDNPGMTSGTYSLRGFDALDDYGYCKSQYLNMDIDDCPSPYYESNMAVLQTIFGTNTNYCTDYSSYYECRSDGLYVYIDPYGYVITEDGYSMVCNIFNYGLSECAR